MASRGAYRSVYSALPDDPDFQRLTPAARLTLYTARLCRDAGPSAIFRYYPSVLMAQTGLTAKQLETSLVELQAGRWIEYDTTVLWVRNGLRYDPAITLANPKHRTAIEAHVRELPKSGIVLSFCDYYKIAYPFDTHSIPITEPENTGRGKGIREREPDKGEGKGVTVVVLSDDQFLDSLRQNPAYHGIDLDRELAKMDAWLLTPKARGRKKTRQFIVNWLNKVDQPLAGSDSPFDPTTAANIKAGQAVLERLKGGRSG